MVNLTSHGLGWALALALAEYAKVKFISPCKQVKMFPDQDGWMDRDIDNYIPTTRERKSQKKKPVQNIS